MDNVDTIPESRLYDEDFYTWTLRQAALMRARRFEEIDWSNIVEEIETLGRSERNALRSSYRLVAMHLLKFKFQPLHRTESWRSTIVRERNAIGDSLRDNPGLRPKRNEIFAEAYSNARREAASETKLGLKAFSVVSPFTLDEIEDHEFWPVVEEG